MLFWLLSQDTEMEDDGYYLLLPLLSFLCFCILLITVLACIEFHGASGGKVTLINHKVHEEKVHEPSNEFDNEPLSKWIEEIHMSSATDGSSKLTFVLVPSLIAF